YIDEKHRAILAFLQEELAMLAAENCVRGAGGSNHNIGAISSVVKVLEADGLAAESMCNPNGAFVGAVGNDDRGGSVRQQMAGGQLAHLARSDQIYAAPVPRVKDLLRQVHG